MITISSITKSIRTDLLELIRSDLNKKFVKIQSCLFTIEISKQRLLLIRKKYLSIVRPNGMKIKKQSIYLALEITKMISIIVMAELG